MKSAQGTKMMKGQTLGFGLGLALVTALALPVSANPSKYDAISDSRGLPEGSVSKVCGDCEPLRSKVTEFANGNTFVKYESEVGGRSVIVRVPETMSGDIMMEVLMRVRTLETLGASDVAVEVVGKTSKMSVVDANGAKISLPISLLLSVAGASSLVDASGDVMDLSLMALDNERELRRTKNAAANGSVVIDPGSHPELAASIGAELAAPLLNKRTSVQGKQVLLFASPLPPVNESLFKTLSDLERLTKNGAAAHLVSPYLPYARSDKMDQGGITTGGSLIADLIKAAGARSITYARAHAPQASGFYQIPPHEASSYETLIKGTKHENFDLFISPDAGAVKDVTKAADYAGVPIATINKQRDGNSIRMRGMTLPSGMTSLEGKRVLVLDDETASGSTLDEAAQECKRQGAAYVGVAVTHLAGEAAKALNSTAIDAIYVTNSIPVRATSEKLHVLSLATEIASQLLKGALRPQLSCVRALGNRH